MGQRIIIVAEIKQYDKKIRVAYHKQWGYGFRGARACLGLLMSNYFDMPYGENVLDDKYKERLAHPPNKTLSEYFTDEELSKYEKEDGELDMATVIANHDNNNGGIYLQIGLDDYGQTRGGRIRFYRGYEEQTDEANAGDKVDMADYLAFHHEPDTIAPLLLAFKLEDIEVD